MLSGKKVWAVRARFSLTEPRLPGTLLETTWTSGIQYSQYSLCSVCNLAERRDAAGEAGLAWRWEEREGAV